MSQGTGKSGKRPQQRLDRLQEIHSILLAEVLTKSGDFPHGPYFGEILDLRPKRPTSQWLEAIIMVCAIGRMRPSQAMRYLRQLRDIRGEEGNPEAFTLFRDRLDTYLSPDLLTNHGYKPAVFGSLDHDEIWAHVGALITTLKNEGYEVFLNSGTLLGIVREGRLIEHDDDIDLAVVIPADSEERAASAWKALRDKLEAKGLLDPDGRNQPGIFKLNPKGSTEIDLFPAWVSDGRVFVYPHTYGQLSREEVLPAKPCAITGFDLPAEPEKMLALNYGDGWQTPDPLFKFPWTQANRTFSTFLERLTDD